MSLADCFKQAGKALSGQDKGAVEALVAEGMSEVEAIDKHLSDVNAELDGVVGQVEEAGGLVQRREPSQLDQPGIDGGPAFRDSGYIFEDVRDRFLDALPEDAGFDDVINIADSFGREYRNFINALKRDDWLGFDYPAQAISAALSEDIDNYDVSQSLKASIGRMVNKVVGGVSLNQSAVNDGPDSPAWQAAKAKGLDMSQEARMERARKMGFDTGKIQYHGTDSIFSEFAINPPRRNYGDEASKAGTFFTDAKESAQEFGGNVGEYYLRLRRNKKITDADISGYIDDWLDGLRESDPDEYEYQIATKQYANSQDIGKGLELAILDAKDRNYSSATWVDYEYGEERSIVFDPSNIRSVNAAFDPDQADSPVLLAQDGKDSPRGTISLLPNGERLIQLGKDSDPTTFLHETAHLFLELEKQLAVEFGITEDQQTLLDWLGVESFDDITVEHHEKFAETFETYLETGNAPSLALSDIFAAFRRWITAVYRSLDMRDRADLTPEIKEVFDRLLASEDAINEAQSDPAYDQFFKSKEQAGMTDIEWEAYQKRVQRAKDKAQVTLDQQVVNELRRRKSAEWKAEKAPIIEQEKERLSKLPEYQILADTKDNPMNHAIVADINGGKIPGNMIGKTKRDGIDPAEYAEVYGYASADQMIKAIKATPPLNKAATEAAEALMIEKHGDILNDGTIEREAEQALQNDDQAKLILAELKALAKKIGKPSINRAYLKAQAKQMIEGMTYAEIKPSKFYRAEIRAAKKAVGANEAEAYEAKVQQIVNHYLYRESLLAREAMKRQRNYVRRVQTRKYNEKDVHPSYINKLKMVANMYDLRTNPERVNHASDVINWYEGQLSSKVPDITLLDENLIKALAAKELSVDNQIPSDFPLPSFDDLTGEELRGVYDQLRHLRFIGGQLSDQQAAETAAITRELVDSIVDNGGKDKKGTRGIPDVWETAARTTSHLVNKLPSLINMTRKLDGFTKAGQGPMFQRLYGLVTEGSNKSLQLQKEFYEKFKTELKDINDIGLTRNDSKEYRLSDGRTFSIHSESRFVMGLYWGTESSREAVRQGWDLTDADVKMILADLTDKQLDVMEAVWAMNEDVWPLLAEAGVQRYGVAPPKLDHVPFSVRGRVMRGGHLRLFYDSTRTELKDEQQQSSKTMEVMPSKAGSLHSRVGSGGMPPLLDANNITRALNESIHFIAFAEPAAGIRRIVNNEEVKGAIERKHGVGFYKAFIESIDSVTGNRKAKEVVPAMAGLLRHLRKSVSYQYIVLSVRNVTEQISAIPMAMNEVGSKRFVDASSRIVSDPSLLEFIRSRSPFMDNRASVVNKTASDYFHNLSIGDLNIKLGKTVTVPPKIAKAYRFVEQHGYMFQTQMDALMAYPVWLAKYEQVLESFNQENPNASQAETDQSVKTAITLADTAVAESVGSGADIHLGGLYQSSNNEWVQFFTMMGSWFNNQYQRIYRDTKGFTTIAEKQAVMSVLVIPMISALMSSAIRMDGPDEEEAWWLWALKQYGLFLTAMVPLLRDVASANIDQRPLRNVWEGAAQTPLRVVNEINAYGEDRQTGIKTTADLLSTFATLIPLPGSGNIVRTLDYMDSYNRGLEGRTFNPYQALVEGSNKNDRQR